MPDRFEGSTVPGNPLHAAVAEALREAFTSDTVPAAGWHAWIADQVLKAARELYGGTPDCIRALLEIANRVAYRHENRQALREALRDLLVPGHLPDLELPEPAVPGDRKLSASAVTVGLVSHAADTIALAVAAGVEAIREALRAGLDAGQPLPDLPLFAALVERLKDTEAIPGDGDLDAQDLPDGVPPRVQVLAPVTAEDEDKLRVIAEAAADAGMVPEEEERPS